MGRHSTIPDLFDDCRTVSITKLKAWGYIIPHYKTPGTIHWSIDGVQTGAIGILVDMDYDSGSITFDYNCNKEPVNYKVSIISKPSNLGNGRVWFFVCPRTGKYCRKLHLAGKYFLHRTALSGYMYEVQTMSKTHRMLTKSVYRDLINEKYYEEIYSKHFKKYYNGKPTKRYLALLKRVGEQPGKYA